MKRICTLLYALSIVQTMHSSREILDMLLLNSMFEQMIAPESSSDTISAWNSLYAGPNGTALNNIEKTILTFDRFRTAIHDVLQYNIQNVEEHVINDSYQTSEKKASLQANTELLYAQKLIVPAGSTIYCWGDVHGDIASLLSVLTRLKETGILNENFKIIKPHTYIISCGDFVDRGYFGVEVIYILSVLKRQNPEQVILMRGNHEIIAINYQRPYAFYDEFQRKFPEAKTILPEPPSSSSQTIISPFKDIFEPFYASLPSVLYLGVNNTRGAINYIQFCHGGLEFYDVSTLLSHTDPHAIEIIEMLNRKTVFTGIKTAKSIDNLAQRELVDTLTPTSGNLGFLWSDFKAVAGSFRGTTSYKEHRGFIFGQKVIESLVQSISGKAHIAVIIRGHEHNDSMPQLLDHEKNHSIYKLPYLNSSIVTVITNVLTTSIIDKYMLSRGFMKIEIPSSDITTWTLEGFWQPRNYSAPWAVYQKNTFAAWKNAAEAEIVK